MDNSTIKAQYIKWLKNDINNGNGCELHFNFDDFFFHCNSYGAVSLEEQEEFEKFLEGIKIKVEITNVIT